MQTRDITTKMANLRLVIPMSGADARSAAMIFEVLADVLIKIDELEAEMRVRTDPRLHSYYAN